jgi:riboflavin synthase
MFTGIVDHCGQIHQMQHHGSHVSMAINSNFTDLVVGESIAIDGACLTVKTISQSQFTVDVSPETIRLTTAVKYQEGTQINLERSLRLMDRLGGHFVTGHVDGLCQVQSITVQDQFIEISFNNVAKEHKPYLAKKGSVAVNGVSLTINDVTENGFTVMLIPHTLEITNLSSLQVGSHVNIEYDYLAKLVVNQMNSERS